MCKKVFFVSLLVVGLVVLAGCGGTNNMASTQPMVTITTTTTTAPTTTPTQGPSMPKPIGSPPPPQEVVQPGTPLAPVDRTIDSKVSSFQGTYLGKVFGDQGVHYFYNASGLSEGGTIYLYVTTNASSGDWDDCIALSSSTDGIHFGTPVCVVEPKTYGNGIKLVADSCPTKDGSKYLLDVTATKDSDGVVGNGVYTLQSENFDGPFMWSPMNAAPAPILQDPLEKVEWGYGEAIQICRKDDEFPQGKCFMSFTHGGSKVNGVVQSELMMATSDDNGKTWGTPQVSHFRALGWSEYLHRYIAVTWINGKPFLIFSKNFTDQDDTPPVPLPDGYSGNPLNDPNGRVLSEFRAVRDENGHVALEFFLYSTFETNPDPTHRNMTLIVVKVSISSFVP